MTLYLKYIFTAFLFFQTDFLFAQKQGQQRIDSLKVEFANAKVDSVRVNILNNLSRTTYLMSDYGQAGKYAEEALQLAEKSKFKKGIADAYNGIGNVCLSQGNNPKALENYLASLKIREEIGDKQGTASSALNIGNVYRDRNDYFKALQSYHNALKRYEETGDKKGVSDSYNSIGIVYAMQGNYPKALEGFLVSLKIKEEIGDKWGITKSQGNIGGVYQQQGNYPKALEYHLASLKIQEEIGDNSGIASTYNNIGGVYQQQGNYPKALENLYSSLKIEEEIGHKYGMVISYSNLGSAYNDQSDYSKSLEYHHKSLEISREIESKQMIATNMLSIGKLYIRILTDTSGSLPQTVISSAGRREFIQTAISYIEEAVAEFKALRALYEYQDAQKSLSIAYELLGDTGKAYKAFKEHVIYKDSVFNEENTKEITRLEMNYVFEKQQDSIRLVNEKEIAIRDATLETNRKQKWLYMGGLAGLAVIGGLLFYQNRQRKKNNEKLVLLNSELDEANRVKSRFFGILSHDLRHPVASLVSFLTLQQEAPEDISEEDKKTVGTQIFSSAKNLLHSMEDLLLWSKGQMENFKPEPKKITVNQLFEDTKKVFSGYQSIRFEYHNPDAIEVFTDENYLKTIIRNLTSNAINAFTTIQNPQIIWKAFQQNEKTVLSITDNGPGATQEQFKALYDENEVVGIKSGLGLHLIRDLAKAIDCTIKVDSQPNHGTTFTLEFV